MTTYPNAPNGSLQLSAIKVSFHTPITVMLVFRGTWNWTSYLTKICYVDKLVFVIFSIGPCTANIFADYNQQDATFTQFIYFRKTLYMFQTSFPSIIRSSKLHIQRQVFVRPLLLPAASLAGLAAGSSNGLTNTWRCMCSFELLMMDGKTVWNM